MCKYNYKLLADTERLELLPLIEKYKHYDKLDILIEMIIGNPSEFTQRTLKIIKEKVVVNEIPEGIKYCDGDSCEIDYSKPRLKGGGC